MVYRQTIRKLVHMTSEKFIPSEDEDGVMSSIEYCHPEAGRSSSQQSGRDWGRNPVAESAPPVHEYCGT